MIYVVKDMIYINLTEWFVHELEKGVRHTRIIWLVRDLYRNC